VVAEGNCMWGGTTAGGTTAGGFQDLKATSVAVDMLDDLTEEGKNLDPL